MTECTTNLIEFSPLKRHRIQAGFTGGEITSDGGALLLRQVDRLLGLTRAVDGAIDDPRAPSRIVHSQLHLLRQRIYGLALGYEDLNDHDTLRKDSAVQTAVESNSTLGSSPTLCRLENRAGRQMAVKLHEVMIEQFISSFKEAPNELILDFDATDDAVHGQQEQRFFHGYYDHYCFLPLYVFCDEQLLVSYLRPSNIDGAKHAWAILSLLVKRLRRSFPKVKIIFRGDSGFCRWKMLSWCERHNVHYIVGIAKNKRLKALLNNTMEQAQHDFDASGKQQKVRLFTHFEYAAKSWNRKRHVIGKAEITDKGTNPRFIVTNLKGDSQALYDELYCARGNMENQIKQQQLDLFADRTSCHKWYANQFRLLMSSMAYILLEALRRIGLKGTKLAHAYVSTLRLKLLKIGAVILKNTRRIQLLFSSCYPYQSLFTLVHARLKPG